MLFPHLGAFESTSIVGSGQDVLGTTEHINHWQEDLERLNSAGIQQLRYPIPWHRIEREPGMFDWSWIDGPLNWMRHAGLVPILDPLHHVSFPDWLENGFENPLLPALYSRFVQNVASRYEWVHRYTVVNEPLPTLVLCGLTGDWYPYRRSEAEFVAMAKNVARTICMAGSTLLKVNPAIRFYHIDSCEHHRALDKQTETWAVHANQRRFLFHDLILGRMHKHHELLPFLRKHGFTEDERLWFQDHASTIDVLGLDYYAHSEIDWKWQSSTGRQTIDFPCSEPLGFAVVAQQYIERFGLPVMLSETNVGGSVTDRITWLKFMEGEAEKVAAVADFRGFCWFPSIDAMDWDSLCTVADEHLSPIGIWSLDQDRKRRASELSQWYVRLATGECRSADLPAYRWTPPLDKDLNGYARLMDVGTVWRDGQPSQADAGQAA